MNFKHKFYTILIFTLLIPGNSYAQLQDLEYDKCGYNSGLAKSYLHLLGEKWGYSYDSLLIDLDTWATNPYISIDSLGASVQNRAIWQLAITKHDTASSNKQMVFFHARTHPGEIQSWWVTEEVIKQLTSESKLAQTLRDSCVFYILPMYNPDGVELEYPRENAHGIDIESNWNKDPLEPEVAVLKARFTELMASDNPIKIAMNMHSAYGQHRFFYYHDSVGTSPAYTILEQDYISDVRTSYLNGIEPWDYRVSWTTSTPTYYPESWFWINHQEAVMSLTYEDWNDVEAHGFDSTANALLHGIADFLDIDYSTTVNVANLMVPSRFELMQNYPNPFNPLTKIEFELSQAEFIELNVFDVRGKTVAELYSGSATMGRHLVTFDAGYLASGIYIYQLKAGNFSTSKKMLVVK